MSDCNKFTHQFIFQRWTMTFPVGQCWNVDVFTHLDHSAFILGKLGFCFYYRKYPLYCLETGDLIMLSYSLIQRLYSNHIFIVIIVQIMKYKKKHFSPFKHFQSATKMSWLMLQRHSVVQQVHRVQSTVWAHGHRSCCSTAAASCGEIETLR